MKATMILLGVALMLALTACNMPNLMSAGESPVQGSPTILAPVNLAGPGVGTTMRWFDNNTLVFVPAGEFPMGVPSNPSDLSEEGDNPLHKVYLDDFWIYRYKVTNEMYQLCVAVGVCTLPKDQAAATSYNDPEHKDHPVVGVDWAQAVAYCDWMDARLPTEAEWEKTARSPQGNLYPWGDSTPTCDLLNFGECVGGTSNVFDFPAGKSYYEAFDMAGNAFEWVADWYGVDYYSKSPATNPPGPESGQARSVRASSFKSASEQLSSAGRFFLDPELNRGDLGFRCVVADPVGFAPFCQLTAFIPGEPGSGPGEPPPGGGDGPGPEMPPGCKPPPPSLSSVNYCANQGAQQGAANVKFEGFLGGALDECDDFESPMVCVGPENITLEIPVCTSCEPPPGEPVMFDPVCAPGYVLVNLVAQSWCVYEGVPAEPGGDCPHGFFLDLEAGVCVEHHVEPNENCPSGYSFDSTAGCCTATFTEPQGGTGGIPGNLYPGCPVGFFYHPVLEQCVAGPADGGPPVTACKNFEVVLGNCADPGGGETEGCKPPGGGCGGGTPQWCAANCSCISATSPCP